MSAGEDVDARRSKKSGVKGTLVEERTPTRGDATSLVSGRHGSRGWTWRMAAWPEGRLWRLRHEGHPRFVANEFELVSEIKQPWLELVGCYSSSWEP